VIREDRELLAELARINTTMASLALRMMDNSASAAEQQDFAHRLIAVGERLRARADKAARAIIEGEVVESRVLPGQGNQVADPSPRNSSIQTQLARVTHGQTTR
jgi:hypothetical protein